MPVVAQCRECGKQYRMKDDLKGKMVPCKECGADMRVPGGPRGARPASPAKAAAPAPARPAPARPASGRPARPAAQPAARQPAQEAVFEPEEGSGGSSAIWIIGGAASVVVIAGILVAVFIVFGGRGDDDEGDNDNSDKVVQNGDEKSADNGGGDVNPPRGNGGDNNPPGNNGGGNNGGNNGGNIGGNPGGLQPPPGGQNPPPPVFGGNKPPVFNPPPVNNNPGGLIPAGGDGKAKDFGNANALVWNVKVDPPKEAIAFTKKGQLKLKAPESFWADAIYPTSNSLFVALGSNNDARSYRDVYDLRTGDKIGQIGGLKLGFSKGKLSPNGLYFAAKTRETKGIGLFDVKKKKGIGVLPVDEKSQTASSMKILEFAGDSRIVAAGSNTPLWTWSLPEGKPGKSVELPKDHRPETVAFSPGGRYMAIYCRSFRDWSVHVFDLDSGALAGKIELPNMSLSHCHMAFSSDGAELGIFFEFIGKSHLFVWDVAAGKQLAYMKFQIKSFHIKGPKLQWFPDKSKWLVMGNVIVDRKAGGPIWALPKIQGAKGVARILDNDRIAMFGETGRVKGLGTFQIPHDKLAKAAKVVGAGGTTDDVNLPPLKKPVWTGTREIDSNGVAAGWSVKPDPGGAAKTKAGATNIDASFGRPTEVMLSGRAAARALVLSEARRPANDGKTPVIRLDWYDVSSKRQIGQLPITYAGSLLAFSPSGRRALIRSKKSEDRLDCWSLDEKQPVAGWRPFKDEKHAHQRKVNTAAFVDDDHILTVSAGRKIALWKLPECKAVYVMGNVSQQPLVSPGGKYLAVAVGQAYRFFDARTGQAVGDIGVGGVPQAGAFHPDGDRFAAVYVDAEGAKIGTWSLSDGKTQASFPVPASGTRLHWCGSGHLLLNNASLIDLAKKMVVWSYSGHKHAPDSPDGRHWYLTVGRPMTLTGVDLPDPGVKAALAGRPLHPKTVLKPGMKVSLNVSLNGINEPGLQNEIVQSWTRKLQARGITLAANQPMTLFARATKEQTGKTSTFTRSNSRFGFGRIPRIGGRPRNVNPGERTENVSESIIKCRIVFGLNNKAYGERKSDIKNVYDGMRVTVRKDETVQSHVDTRQSRMAAGFFKGYSPPGYIFETGAERGLGASQFVSGGARMMQRPQ